MMVGVDISRVIEELELMFPDKIQTEDMTPFERGKEVGAIELIRLLNMKYLEQEDENNR